MPTGPDCFYLAAIHASSTGNSLSCGGGVLGPDLLPHGVLVCTDFWSPDFWLDPVMVGVTGRGVPHKGVYTVPDRRCAVGGREMELVLCRFATHRRGFPEPVYIRLRLVTFLFRISRPRAVDSGGGRPAPPGRPPCFYLSRACPARSRPTILSNCPVGGGEKRL